MNETVDDTTHTIPQILTTIEATGHRSKKLIKNRPGREIELLKKEALIV